jgi:transcriptional regulator with XRE-family HTH domain
MSKGIDKQALAERIKEVQKHFNLNSRKFAAEIGMDTSQLSKIESGNLGLSTSYATTINEQFGVNVNWLLTGKGEKGSWNRIPYFGNEVREDRVPYGNLIGEQEERLLRIEAHLEVYENAIAGLLAESKNDFVKKVGELRAEVQSAVNRRFDELSKRRGKS